MEGKATNRVNLSASLRDIENTYFFNPTILDIDDTINMIFRKVTADGHRKLCYAEFDPAGTKLKDDDLKELRLEEGCAYDIKWFADPRVFYFNEQPFVCFNTGHSQYPNQQYISKLNHNGEIVKTFKVCLAERQVIEKNWAFFEHNSELYCIYKYSPFEVLKMDFRGNECHAYRAFVHQWLSKDYQDNYGVIRGGTSPLKIDKDTFWTIVQSRTNVDGGKYGATIMAFSAKPPFAPQKMIPTPYFKLSEKEKSDIRVNNKLNPNIKEVFYPCGAAYKNDKLFVSYGINDTALGLLQVDKKEIQRELHPITRISSKQFIPYSDEISSPEKNSCEPIDAGMRCFFWKARRKRFIAEEPNINDFRFGNVGDEYLEHLIAKSYKAKTILDENSGSRFLGVGSIAHRAQENDILWGVGYKEAELSIPFSKRHTINAIAVRGPLTEAYLKRQGVHTGNIKDYFDSGLLLNHFFNSEIECLKSLIDTKQSIGIIPHYRHEKELRKEFGEDFNFISVDQPLMICVAEILSKELIISSSLHGVIFAESLGIPAILLKPPLDEPFEKYIDYYEGTNRPQFPILQSPYDAAQVSPLNLPKINASKWTSTLPSLQQLGENKIYCTGFDPNLELDITHSPLFPIENDSLGKRLVFGAGKSYGVPVKYIFNFESINTINKLEVYINNIKSFENYKIDHKNNSIYLTLSSVEQDLACSSFIEVTFESACPNPQKSLLSIKAIPLHP